MESRASPEESSSDPAEAILARCLGLPEAERASAIEEACAQNPAIAGELRAGVDALRDLGVDLPPPTGDFPEELGDFRLIERLGGGGMGVVFRAWQISLKRDVALKLIRPEHLYFEGSRERFRREAETVARLQHPGIVPIFAVGEEQGIPYFAMERIRGCTLAEVLRTLRDRAPESLTGADLHRVVSAAAGSTAPRPEASIFDGTWVEACLGIARQVATALAYAHERGLVHRDVKPSNLALTPDGRVLLLDFGLVRTDHEGELTRTGTAIGTLHYMSPEHLLGGKSVDARSDVYSLGITLYEMLALQVPYRGETSFEIERLVREGRPDPLRARNRRVDADLETAVLCAIDRDPARRYRSAADFARDLAHLIARRPIEARRPGPWLRARRWVQRHPARATALVLGPGLVLLVGVAALLREKSHSRALGDRLEETRKARDEARRERANVLRLSAFQALGKLEREADGLWPSSPALLPAMQAWIDRAEALVGEIPRHVATLEEIRGRARPRTPERIEADRRANPSVAEWERSRSELAWIRRMSKEEPWPDEAALESELAREDLPSDASSLGALAWPLVDPSPGTAIYGSEVRGLLIAKRALAASGGAQRATSRRMLAQALYRCGRFDESLEEIGRYLAELGEAPSADSRAFADDLRERVESWDPSSPRSKRTEYRRRAEELSSRVALLEQDIEARRTWEFDVEEDAWWHTELSKLVSDLEGLRDEKRGGLLSAGTSAEHDWGVVKRAEFARSIAERSVSGPEARGRWEEAVLAIARSPKYGGLSIAPQLGLLPIGEDPASHLLEFADLATGDPPERGTDGRLILKESMGLVFVLIPGGTFRMGAQAQDPDAPSYDPLAESDESPVHEVELSPYFLSKYEMTQGQWQRFTGVNPSRYLPPLVESWNRDGKGWSALHPVEQVTWEQCAQVMARLGLELPSEAQWERGARGGTTSVYWTGTEVASLAGAANVADAYGKSHGSESWATWEKDIDDGNTVHADVGSYRANPFGLHDVHGNVWEWCRDGYDGDFYGRSPRLDPVAAISGNPVRASRGGSFQHLGAQARSSMRTNDTPAVRRTTLGLRPARAVSSP